MPATEPVQTFGTILKWAGQAIARVTDITGPGETAENEDVTTHSSPQAYREKIPTILDGGELTFDLIYLGETGQAALRTAFTSRDVDTVTIEWPDDFGGGGNEFDGFVSTWNWAQPVAGVLRASIGITVSGPVTTTDPGS